MMYTDTVTPRTVERDGLSVTFRRVYDESPDLSYLQQECFGQRGIDRYNSYGIGWHMVGVIVEIRKQTATNWATPPLIGQASVWCVESDSAESYFTELETDLLDQALTDAHAMRDAICALAPRDEIAALFAKAVTS